MGELYLRHSLSTDRNLNLYLGGYGSPLQLTHVHQGGKRYNTLGKLGAVNSLCVPTTLEQAGKEIKASAAFTRGIFRQEKPNQK